MSNATGHANLGNQSRLPRAWHHQNSCVFLLDTGIDTTTVTKKLILVKEK
jgi:hypothetical protein